jgi:alpha-galactosidase
MEGLLRITRKHLLSSAIFVLAAAVTFVSANAQPLAPTPPMGWNSWDAYGLAITEPAFRANADVLARELKPYGWTYAVIDEGWFLRNPQDRPTPEKLVYVLDENGRYIPDPSRFPSALKGGRNIGFEAIASAVHARGLKFGIHIVRGIPRESVARNLPVAGSAFHAQDVADTADACPWDPTNWGVKNNAAGQAWYDSLIAQYARWGVDYLKVDCISDHPYKPAEIRMIHNAIAKSGRPIVLSLSPGPTAINLAAEVASMSQLWRISDDVWDVWSTKGDWPRGIDEHFSVMAKWAPLARPGGWPDADMLPFGYLGPTPGWGDPRQTQLTQAEQRSVMTLWAIGRSPLILGANLTRLDPFTRSLITNRAVIAVDQKSWESHAIEPLPAGFEHARVWAASSGPRAKPVRYVAFFNLGAQPSQLSATWKQLGIAGAHSAVELWSGTKLKPAASISVSLPAHGSAIYRVE